MDIVWFNTTTAGLCKAAHVRATSLPLRYVVPRVQGPNYVFTMPADIRSFFGGKVSTPVREKESKKEVDSKKKKTSRCSLALLYTYLPLIQRVVKLLRIAMTRNQLQCMSPTLRRRFYLLIEDRPKKATPKKTAPKKARYGFSNLP